MLGWPSAANPYPVVTERGAQAKLEVRVCPPDQQRPSTPRFAVGPYLPARSGRGGRERGVECQYSVEGAQGWGGRAPR